jgi:alkanesulfonate monooxygenase SsuD/methylene tetrahydromethanopterin reductase-like flavin-dependent oxidoreductase (luciferase family)
MGAGGSGTEAFARAVPQLREALDAEGRDRATFPISKRVFLSVHADGATARAEVERWFATAYLNPALTAQAGVFGTPDDVGEQLEALVAAGATHLLLNPVTRFEEQLEVLGAIVGLT